MLTLTKKELSNAAGYTYRRLYDIDRSLPPGKKLFCEQEDGKCDLQTFVRNWVEYNQHLKDGAPEDLETVKARHEVIKTQKTELEVQRMRGQLIDLQDVKKLWGDVANTVTQNLLHVPAKVAPLIRMMDSAERIAEVVRGEITLALTAVSETPIPDYAEYDEMYEQDEDETETETDEE